MPETRQIGRLVVHFLGDSAAPLAKSFDGSLAGSQSFRDAMNETARTQRHIYVGSSLEDLRDQPGFDRAGFDPNSERARNTNAFGRPSGADSYFVVVTNKEHHLAQKGGKTFPGSTDLSLVHEFLHPSQMMRTLAESGKLETDESEARTQMREQKIAEELGRTPGKDFPDIFESGPYAVKLESPKVQPMPAPSSDSAPPIDPTNHESGAPTDLTRPMFLPQPGDRSASRPVRETASAAGATPDNPNALASPPDSEGPIGLFSGKPIRFPFAPIFQPLAPAGGASNRNRRSALDNMIWNGLGSRASSPDVDAAPPLVPDRQISSSNAISSASSSGGPGAASAPPMLAPPDSQGPLSLNEAYLEYLKRLKFDQSQVPS